MYTSLSKILLALAAAAPALTTPTRTTSSPGREITAAQPIVLFECSTSAHCASRRNMARDCDIVANEVVERTDTTFYTPAMHNNQGSSFGEPRALCYHDTWTNNFGAGCGLQIKGPPECARSGNQLWWDYQLLTNCENRCGDVYWASVPGGALNCRTSAEYMLGCLNTVED